MAINKIFAIDMMLVVSTLFFLIIAIGYSTPFVISDIILEKQESQVLFTIQKEDTITLYQDLTFNNGESYNLKDQLTISLEPGVYYLQSGPEEFSQITTLTIETDIILAFIETEAGYNIVNTGTNSLDVTMHDHKNVLDEITLNPYDPNKFYRGDT